RRLGSERLLERAAVLARHDPRLERHSRRIGHDGREGRCEPHHSLFGADLLAEDVAVEAAALVLVVLARLAQLTARLVANDADRRQPRVRMVARDTGLLVAARHQDVANLPVAL